MIWEFLPKALDDTFEASVEAGVEDIEDTSASWINIQNERIKQNTSLFDHSRGMPTEKRDDICQFRVLHANVNKLLCKQAALQRKQSGSSRATLRAVLLDQ